MSPSKYVTKYPTLVEVEAADHRQICKWYRFLGSPGMSAIASGDFEEVCAAEAKIMNRIADRLKEFGGFTPEISKSLGWGS